MAKTNKKRSSSKKPGVDPTLARHGGLTYLEIPARDIAQSARFYASVLGWKTGAGEDIAKFSDAGGHLIGRWIRGRMFARGRGFLPYFYVNKITLAVKRVASHGGKIVKQPYAEGNLRIAILRDPAGNLLGIWQGP